MSKALSWNVPIACKVMFPSSLWPINGHVLLIKYAGVRVQMCVHICKISQGGVLCVLAVPSPQWGAVPSWP